MHVLSFEWLWPLHHHRQLCCVETPLPLLGKGGAFALFGCGCAFRTFSLLTYLGEKWGDLFVWSSSKILDPNNYIQTIFLMPTTVCIFSGFLTSLYDLHFLEG